MKHDMHPQGGGPMEQKLTFSDLRSREVINVVTGERLGCVSDLELEIPSGRVLGLIVPGCAKLFGLFRTDDGLCIPFCRVKKFGEDVILVELC